MTTPRMALVPVDATADMKDAAQGEWRTEKSLMAMLTASPHAGKVSPDQHRAAMVALQNSKWPFMPADQRSEIIDIVIAAFGLEKAE